MGSQALGYPMRAGGAAVGLGFCPSGTPGLLPNGSGPMKSEFVSLRVGDGLWPRKLDLPGRKPGLAVRRIGQQNVRD